MVSIGAIYHMVERLWGTTIYSVKLVNLHFWMATIGTAVYITAMWVSGIMQGLMWRAYDDYGNLAYTFVESVAQMHPYYAMRAVGGLIFFLGACVMLFNITVTIRKAVASSSAKEAALVNATV
jgi:cytochrome c oxidase cbb3-type subunit 1